MQPVGQYARVYTATDVCGNLETFIQFITLVDEEAPQFSSSLAMSLPNVARRNSSCLWPSTIARLRRTSFLSKSVKRSQVHALAPTAFVRTFTATDDCGNATTQVQTITVVDTTAPSWSSFPEDVSFDCSESPVLTSAAAIDGCSGPADISLRLTPWQAHVPKHTLVRTFTATDQCGNATSRISRSRVHRQHGTCVCGSAARIQHHQSVTRFQKR